MLWCRLRAAVSAATMECGGQESHRLPVKRMTASPCAGGCHQVKSYWESWDPSNYVPNPLWHKWEFVVLLSPGEISVSVPPQSLAGLRLWLMRLNCYIGQVSLSSELVIARS